MAQDGENDFSLEHTFQKFLAQMELTPSDVTINPDRIEFSSSVELLPFHKLLIQHPFQAVEMQKNLSQHIANYPSTFFVGYLVNMSIFSNQRIEYDTSYSWTTNSSEEDFVETLLKAENLMENELSQEIQEKWGGLYAKLSNSGRILIYELMQCITRAWPWLKRARKSVPQDMSLASLFDSYFSDSLSPEDIKRLDTFNHEFDQRALYLAAAEFAHFLSQFLEKIENQSLQFTENLEVSTPFGSILISSELSDDYYDLQSPPLFLLDMYGNDQYINQYSIADATTPFSITIDMGGEDHYKSEQQWLGSASSAFGFSALLDLGEGDDTYEGNSQCFGYSFAGVSLLYNASGNTNYEIQSHGLGASEWGIAMLIDAEGSDTYRSYYKSQGFGSMKGVGLLLDLEGNDEYIAEATPVIYASSQLPEQNSSASQGFGSGLFGPYRKGYSFNGGIGLLIDKSGNDLYKASVFAQGAGYGFGIGILSDLEGDDLYQNSWYALGSAAHQACGLAYDATGNDQINASHYMVGGAASDLSLGIFVNEYGDDLYEAKNASFGYSLTNSVAMMIDKRGDDQYTLRNGQGLGFALNERQQSIRNVWPTFGFFWDLTGRDRYRLNDQELQVHNIQDPTIHYDSTQKAYQIGVDAPYLHQHNEK